VISMIGSYTSIGYRPAHGNQPMIPGGDFYPTLIRKSPVKPIRIFLQDGENDLSNLTDTKGFKPEWTALANEHGNWHLANLQMLSALEFANANADRKKIEGPRYDIKPHLGRWRAFRYARWRPAAGHPPRMFATFRRSEKRSRGLGLRGFVRRQAGRPLLLASRTEWWSSISTSTI